MLVHWSSVLDSSIELHNSVNKCLKSKPLLVENSVGNNPLLRVVTVIFIDQIDSFVGLGLWRNEQPAQPAQPAPPFLIQACTCCRSVFYLYILGHRAVIGYKALTP